MPVHDAAGGFGSTAQAIRVGTRKDSTVAFGPSPAPLQTLSISSLRTVATLLSYLGVLDQKDGCTRCVATHPPCAHVQVYTVQKQRRVRLETSKDQTKASTAIGTASTSGASLRLCLRLLLTRLPLDLIARLSSCFPVRHSLMLLV